MAAIPEFKYAHMFQHGEDTTEYYLLTKEGVSVGDFEGKPMLKVTPEALTLLSRTAFRDVSFMLRRAHNEQVAKILTDPEASDNDKYVALTFLRNAEVACKGQLPLCQDTGTAIIHGEKGQQVWTGFCDEEALSRGVFDTYTQENLRYSQNAPLTMYDEVNTKCNLPAQIDIEATEGMEYKFLMVTKGGGSANKTYLYQETKALLNPATLVPFLVEKMKSLGTAACPPYHIAFVIGGTSAEKNLLTVKLASTHYYDDLPTTGDETGRAFRDIELEKQLLDEAHRAAAPHIYEVISQCAEMSKQLSPAELTAWVTAEVEKNPCLKVIYFQAVDALSMQQVASWEESDRIQGCIAVQAGEIRLIDNVRIK